MDKLANDNQPGETITDVCNPIRKAIKLLIEWSLDTVINLGFLKHLTHFGSITHFENTHNAMPFHYLCTTHNVV